MPSLLEYNRDNVLKYAETWAFSRNPKYSDYELIGGDCTNFASQCIYAGSEVMNYATTFGWYYVNANNKSPSWTGVEFLWDFLTRQNSSVGPFGELCSINELEAGDLIQLSFDGKSYQHSLIVVKVGNVKTKNSILISAHTYNAFNKKLSSYNYSVARFLHINGVYKN